MQFTRLNIDGRRLTRQDFLNQTHKCFVLPDNIPDFRLPRNQLHQTHNRGGLAAAMRPNRIGGTEANPVYDVHVIGVPTISFVRGEPLTEAHIQQAFEGIYELVGKNQYQEIVVPYVNGQPAFGGGIAGNLPHHINNRIQQEFSLLENFLNNQRPFQVLPLHYKAAFLRGINHQLTTTSQAQPNPVQAQAQTRANRQNSFPWAGVLGFVAGFALLPVLGPSLLGGLSLLPWLATLTAISGVTGAICQLAYNQLNSISQSNQQPPQPQNNASAGNNSPSFHYELNNEGQVLSFSNLNRQNENGVHIRFASYNEICESITNSRGEHERRIRRQAV